MKDPVEHWNIVYAVHLHPKSILSFFPVINFQYLAQPQPYIIAQTNFPPHSTQSPLVGEEERCLEEIFLVWTVV